MATRAAADNQSTNGIASNHHNPTSTATTTSPKATMPQPPPPSLPSTYSRIEPLESSALPPESEMSIFKLAKEVLGSVKRGSDVTNIPLPASILDPVSTLEKTKKSMQRGELLQDLCKPSQDAQSRFLNVLRFNLSGLARERFGKKPFNPVLGEVFRCCFVHRGGGGETLLVAEQVSHHPPITALHLRNETLGFSMNSHTAPEPTFYGNSLQVKLTGQIRIVLEKYDNEEYVITRPSINMTGFIAGPQRLEFSGESTFVCEKTGLAAKITYKAYSSLSMRSELNCVTGRVYQISTGETLYTLDGIWDKIVTLTNSSTQEQSVLFDYEAVVAEKSLLPVLPPEEEEEDSFCTRVWSECSKAIISGESATANIAKQKVEDHQRRLRKERDAAKLKWKCHYFIKRTDVEDGYDLRAELKSSVPKVSISGEELKALKAGDWVDGMATDGGDVAEANGDTVRKGVFRRKLMIKRKKGIN